MIEEKVAQPDSCENTDALFSILIPSWNNLAYLKLCIRSIRKNSCYNHQIIVHINEGKDGSLDWVKAQGNIDYSFSKQNIGVCYALNTAASLAKTSYILYLNDDMYVCPDWDKDLYDEIKRIGHNKFFISGTAIEAYPQSSCSIKGDFGNDISTFEEERLLAEYARPHMPDWQGATWPPNVVHKDIWDTVGGYSIEFSPGMYSDPDFSMKLWKLGIRLFKGVGKSRVYHFGSTSVKRVKKNNGYFTFINKWGLTAGTFSRYYLKRGESYDGPLIELDIPIAIRMKNLMKRLRATW
ncbi:MAG TPA: glycosyltransferase [Dyadobacter sp.]|jgi:glycosyltransferase involved in cell wall biosynthesis|nr:glycosyltransferase [Dyadobacter sp.]